MFFPLVCCCFMNIINFSFPPVKKFRVEVVIPKHPVPEKLLERLRKLSSKKKNTTNHDHKENNSTPSCKTIQKSPLQLEPEALSPTLGESLLCCGEEATSSVQGLLPPPACKSPVEHRLSNLLNGELNSTESYENTDLHVCYGDNVQSIDEYRKSNFTEQVSHLESLRLPLRSTDRQSSEIDTIFPFAQNEDHQLVTGRCLQTVGNAVESSSPTDCSKMYSYLATSLEGKNSGNKLIDERKVLEGDVISKVQKCVTANSHKGKENGLANANCSADNGRTPDTIAKVESVSSSGCLPISDSSQGNSVDFSTNFNTLEVRVLLFFVT